ncbi:hypothetical protein STENM327S_00981 [Streptomyces tendae]
MLDAVVAAGVDGAVELIGPGRVQFAVHAPPIEAEVDPRLLATALAHLVADVAGVDATGNSPVSANRAATWTTPSWSRRRSAARSYGSRCAGRTPGETRCTSRSCAGSCGRTVACCRRTRAGMSGSAYVLEVPIGAGRVPSRPRAPSRPRSPAARTPGRPGRCRGHGERRGPSGAGSRGRTAAGAPGVRRRVPGERGRRCAGRGRCRARDGERRTDRAAQAACGPGRERGGGRDPGSGAGTGARRRVGPASRARPGGPRRGCRSRWSRARPDRPRRGSGAEAAQAGGPPR